MIKIQQLNKRVSLQWIFCICLFFSVENISAQKIDEKVFRFNSIERDIAIPDYVEEEHIDHIHNYKKYINVEFIVENIPFNTSKKFGFEAIQLAISHSYISDIKAELYSPAGTMVWITNRNGKDGANYIETRFSQNGFKGHITQGKPPFLGDYIPDGKIENFNNGENPNGTWVLRVYDLKNKDTGIFNSASLFFSNKPAIKNFSACNFSTPKGCICDNGKKNGWLYPDLQIIEEFTKNNFIEIAPNAEKKGKISFGVQTVNLGLGPLEVSSNNKWYCDDEEVANSKPCNNGNYSRTELLQTVYGIKKGKWITQQFPAGKIAYDARKGHEHFHADNYVSYELLQKDSSNSTISWKIISKGLKASFCIWDLSACRDDIANCKNAQNKILGAKNIQNFGLGGNYNACDALKQGLSVGGVDYYGENFEGQTIDLPKGLPNGTYYLRLIVDPANNYKESNENNNQVIIPIQIIKQ